jgi:hypothetical protein
LVVDGTDSSNLSIPIPRAPYYGLPLKITDYTININKEEFISVIICQIPTYFQKVFEKTAFDSLYQIIARWFMAWLEIIPKR